MFCSNKNQPISLFDPIHSMPKYLKKILDKSWAETFRDKIFPYINEERFEVLYSDNHASKNEMIYRTKDNASESKLEILLKHTHQLYCLAQSLGDKYVTMEEYLLLERVLREQTQENETGKLSPLSGEEISSESLQNPTDPDATYRKKYKGNVGYVANMVQAYGNKNQVITHYDLKKDSTAKTPLFIFFLDTILLIVAIKVIL